MKKIIILAALSAGLCAQSVTFTSVPGNLQFFGRDAQDSALVTVAGNVTPAGPDSVSLLVHKNGVFFKRVAQLPVSGAFSLAVKIHAELASYEFEARIGDSLAASADSVLCGDAFLVDGQSNAENAEQAFATPWLRTFKLDSTWSNPGRSAWGIGRHLIEEQAIPVFMVNGAVSGSGILDHAPDTLTKNTIYGKIFWRVTRSGLRRNIRAVFWHQGEANGGDSINASVEYPAIFRTLYDAWKRDFPGVEHVYIFQVHPGYCGGSYSDVQREIARRLPRQFTDLSIMSTAGIIQHDGCHFGSGGYLQMGDWMVRLVKRDLYASTDTIHITPPDIQSARFEDGNRTRLLLQFDQAVMGPPDSIRDYFYLDGKGSVVDSIRADTARHSLLLVLKGPSKAVSVAYTPASAYRPNYWDGTRWHMFPFDGPWLFNPRGVGALTFWGVPVPADSFLFLDTMVLDFYEGDGDDPVVRLVNQGSAVPAVSAAPESSWLRVEVTGTGSAQVFHHTADLTGLDPGRPHAVNVRLSAAGFKDLVYRVVVRPGRSVPVSLRLDPSSLFVFPGSGGKFALKGLCGNGLPFDSSIAADWAVSGGGAIDSTGFFQSNGTLGVFNVSAVLKADTAVKAQGAVTVDTSAVLPFIRRINFQVSAAPWKAGWLANNGTPFSTVDGMGWLTSVGSSYYPLFGSRDDRQGTNFLLKSFVWADANTPFHIDAPDGDYVIRVGLGDNHSPADVISAQVGGREVCRKAAGAGNAVNTDTITATGNNGIDLAVKGPRWGGAINYLVVISKNGVDMDLVADDGLGPMLSGNFPAETPVPALTAFPNPFNPVGRITARLPEAGTVDLSVYDLRGRLVQRIFNGNLKKGDHVFSWNGVKTASGIYFYKMVCGRHVLRAKAVLAR